MVDRRGRDYNKYEKIAVSIFRNNYASIIRKDYGWHEAEPELQV